MNNVSKLIPKKNKHLTFSEAIHSFVGYLEGTHKSLHTIKNYRLDIQAFRDFIQLEYSGKLVLPVEVQPRDLTNYRDFLQQKGFKTNTRRRKILTVTQFLNYLAKRNKLVPELAKKNPAPHKIERVPLTLSSQTLIELIQALPTATLIEARNRALLWTLAETGCQVSEVTELKFDQWKVTGEKGANSRASVEILGKSPRTLSVSVELYHAVMALQGSSAWIFLGFNKFGALGGPISARGVELLVKSYSIRLGHPDITPRIFRHSAVLRWFNEGLTETEVQHRLGLKTTYAFRAFAGLRQAQPAASSEV